ncbi:hypothetical protein Ddye_011612 [Dipteronia dyeriana]|uniref:Uncharacterized protein n=1 Tax=Dipteronia dyeriana TaxID=168575 RepID=A0AAD9X2V2_9ROSI|nr:hypothetical protein Ddye_011612 [Dipteronia dyeriana]
MKNNTTSVTSGIEVKIQDQRCDAANSDFSGHHKRQFVVEEQEEEEIVHIPNFGNPVINVENKNADGREKLGNNNYVVDLEKISEDRDIHVSNSNHAILQIPVGSRATDDTILWHYDDSGNYTVKSGYRIAGSLMSTLSSSTSNPAVLWWKTLWKLMVPLKVLLSFVNVDELGLFYTIIWRVWFLRNSVLQGSRIKLCLRLCAGKELPERFPGLRSHPAVNSTLVHTLNFQWRPLDPNFYKINCDAKVDKASAHRNWHCHQGFNRRCHGLLLPEFRGFLHNSDG